MMRTHISLEMTDFIANQSFTELRYVRYEVMDTVTDRYLTHTRRDTGYLDAEEDKDA